jgi:hypothetical protein
MPAPAVAGLTELGRLRQGTGPGQGTQHEHLFHYGAGSRKVVARIKKNGIVLEQELEEMEGDALSLVDPDGFKLTFTSESGSAQAKRAKGTSLSPSSPFARLRP